MWAAEKTQNTVQLEFLDQGLHNQGGPKMGPQIQERVDELDKQGLDAILLGYGLCNNAIVGLCTQQTPMVVHRSHDCIGLLMGSKTTYNKVFQEHPGTYYLSNGWIETGSKMETLPSYQSVASDSNKEKLYESYVKRYGEENAKFLKETLMGWESHYTRMVLINNGLGDVETYQNKTRKKAERRGLEYLEMDGKLDLFLELVQGPPWREDDFLQIPPGHEIQPSYDQSIVKAVPRQVPAKKE